MDEHASGEQGSDEPASNAPESTAPAPRRNGWWWRFTALFMGVPPVTVWGAEDEIDKERAENPRD